jgi:hypothetical protein
MSSRRRTVKKAGRSAGAAKGLFASAGPRLRLSKRLSHQGVGVTRTIGSAAPSRPFLRPPRVVRPNAAPYRPEIAGKVPPYGTKGEKTTGVVDLGGEHVVSTLDSGYRGPANDLPKPRRGMDGNLVAHVEAHTAALMRQQNVNEATLYINRKPCSYEGPGGAPGGCSVALPRMLKPGQRLTVYGPNGYSRVYEGAAE